MSERWTKMVGFLGAAANWTIPIASFMNLKNDPSKVDPIMTTTLASYSLVFMRWAIAIYPPNYWLLGCHAANEVAQLTQLTRWGLHKVNGSNQSIIPTTPDTKAADEKEKN